MDTRGREERERERTRQRKAEGGRCSAGPSTPRLLPECQLLRASDQCWHGFRSQLSSDRSSPQITQLRSQISEPALVRHEPVRRAAAEDHVARERQRVEELGAVERAVGAAERVDPVEEVALGAVAVGAQITKGV